MTKVKKLGKVKSQRKGKKSRGKEEDIKGRKQKVSKEEVRKR